MLFTGQKNNKEYVLTLTLGVPGITGRTAGETTGGMRVPVSIPTASTDQRTKTGVDGGNILNERK